MGKTKDPTVAATITTTAVLLALLLLHVQQQAFFSHIYSFHWLDFGWRVTTPTGLWTTKGYGLGCWGQGGVQDICFLAFFALFHGLLCLFRIQREGRQRGQQDMSVEIWRDANRGCSRRPQRIGRPCRNTLGSNCTSYFLSDQWIHFKTFFFSFVFLLNVLVTRSSPPLFPCTAVDSLILGLVQQFHMSHHPLPQQSAHMGGATNECSWWFIHAKAEGKTNTFLFCHCLKNPYALWYIWSPHYLNLFNAVQCICSPMSDVLLYLQILRCWILPRKKVHDLLARKVLARVLMV